MALVVVAEDNLEHQRILVEILRRLRHEPVVVGDGRAALAAIAARRPDLVIADVEMPELDGVQLCRTIRDNPELAEIPVILVTAYLPSRDPQLHTAGAAVTVPKPFSVQQLTEAVHHCLDPDRASADTPADRLAAADDDAPSGLTHTPGFVTALLESLDIGVAVCDRHGGGLLLNQPLRALFGADNTTVAQSDWSHRFQLRHHDGTPLTAEEFPLTRALAGEHVKRAETMAYDPRDQPRWLLVNARPIRDGTGQIIGAVAAGHDVSAEHQARRYQQCKNAVLEALAGAPDAAAATTAALHAIGTWLDWPYVRLWLIDPVSDRLTSATTFTAPGAEPLPIPGSIPPGHGLAGLCWQRGEPIWVPDIHAPGLPLPEVTRGVPYRAAGAVPVRSGTTVVGVLTYFSHHRQESEPALTVLLTGITGHLGAHLERRRADELAQQLAASIEEYVALVGHELRTPLTSITAYIDLIRQEPDDTRLADLRELLDVVVRNSTRLLNLVDQLLDLVALESGNARLQSTSVDVAAIVRDAVAAAHPKAEAHQLTLHSDLPAQVNVSGDLDRLRQVVDCLLDNAIKYSPEQATITVTLTHPDDVAVLEVTNPGADVTADEYPQLTRRLYRGRNVRHHGIPGAGLGLTLSRAIIERHHGTLPSARILPPTSLSPSVCPQSEPRADTHPPKAGSTSPPSTPANRSGRLPPGCFATGCGLPGHHPLTVSDGRCNPTARPSGLGRWRPASRRPPRASLWLSPQGVARGSAPHR
ncbi:response regulator [Couchioplanes caeruleus subsp. azureus]